MGDWDGQIFADRGVIMSGHEEHHRKRGPDGRYLVTIKECTRPSKFQRGWSMTDAAGHEHHCPRPGEYPTLIRVDDEQCANCEGCCATFVRYHLECRECGEQIWPSIHGPETEIVPLKKRWRYVLDGQEITAAQAEAFLEDDDDPDGEEAIAFLEREERELAQQQADAAAVLDDDLDDTRSVPVAQIAR
jgi:hypothetical protein